MSEDLKEQIVSKVVESVPTLLIVLGALLAVLGFSGGITYHQWLPIPDTQGRVGAVILGLVLIGLGWFRRATQQVPNASQFGIKIEYPVEGETVDRVTVRGTFKKRPPEGYVLKVFKVVPGSESFGPIGEGRVTTAEKWQADNCDIGGKPGEQRYIAVFLVGPDDLALLEYHAKAAKAHSAALEQLPRGSGAAVRPSLPLIEKRTQDMIECHRISVRRK